MLLFVSLSVSKRTNLQEQVVSDNDKGSWAGLYTKNRVNVQIGFASYRMISFEIILTLKWE